MRGRRKEKLLALLLPKSEHEVQLAQKDKQLTQRRMLRWRSCRRS
jgi:hypothetical protein